MMHNITSDCKMFTRLANRGQNGGKTGGGSAENKVIIGFFCRTCLKKKNQPYLLIVFTQRIFINTYLKAVFYLLKVKCVKTSYINCSSTKKVFLFPRNVLGSEIKPLTQRWLSTAYFYICTFISLLNVHSESIHLSSTSPRIIIIVNRKQHLTSTRDKRFFRKIKIPVSSLFCLFNFRWASSA